MTDLTYNGWANHATWNVALWIGGDEGLYSETSLWRCLKTDYLLVFEGKEGTAHSLSQGDVWAVTDGAGIIASGDEQEAADKGEGAEKERESSHSLKNSRS